jgi:hypothetical protein
MEKVMKQDYGIAFGVFKDERKDEEGNTYLAEAHLGFFGGLLAGIDIAVFRIKSHPVKGMQIEWPEGIKVFASDEAERIEVHILKAFMHSYIQQTGGEAIEEHACTNCGKCDLDDEVPDDTTFN